MQIIIIGAGLAGITVANRLHEKGYAITILERGTTEIKIPNDIKFESRAFGMNATHSWNIGGTTALWHGGLMPMSELEIESAQAESKIYNLKEELTFYYKKILGEKFGLKAKKLSASNVLESLLSKINKVGILIPKKPEKLTPAKGIKIITNINLIEFNTSRKRIQSCIVHTSDLKTELPTDVIIVSAGGLGSPTIVKNMLNSAGLENRNVGHWLIDHPMGFVGKIKISKRFPTRAIIGSKFANGYLLRNGYSVLDEDSGLVHCIYLRPSATLNDNADLYEAKRQIATYRANKNILKLLKLLVNKDILLEAMALKLNIRVPTKYYSLLIVSEQKPAFERYIYQQSNSSREVKWFVNENEILSIKRSIREFTEYFKDEIEEMNICEDVATRLWSAAHHSGTCRMAASSSEGVVDKNLKIHGLDNAYVCDGSVLPRTGYSNTGITIMALSERLADHLCSH